MFASFTVRAILKL